MFLKKKYIYFSLRPILFLVQYKYCINYKYQHAQSLEKYTQPVLRNLAFKWAVRNAISIWHHKLMVWAFPAQACGSWPITAFWALLEGLLEETGTHTERSNRGWKKKASNVGSSEREHVLIDTQNGSMHQKNAKCNIIQTSGLYRKSSKAQLSWWWNNI